MSGPAIKGISLHNPSKFRCMWGSIAKGAVLPWTAFQDFYKSCLTSHPLLVLFLLPARLQGSFCPSLEETVLSNITCNFLVWKAAACSLITPGAFPVFSFWSHPLLPRNTHPTILPSDPTHVCRPTSHITSCRKLSLCFQSNAIYYS